MNSFVFFGCLFAVVVAVPEAPYQPSGWRPQGAQFNLPARQYGSPSQDYGPAETTTESATTTVEPDSEDANNSSRFIIFPNRASAQLNQANGQFFIIGADGSVQHVAIPTPAQPRQQKHEPDSELVSSVSNAAPLGQLVRLTSAPIRQQSGRLVSAVPQQNQPISLFRVSERQQVAPSQATNSAEFFALTTDGRLQRLQARPASSEKQIAATSQTPSVSTVLLTPEGKFERLQLQPVQAAQKEENGQYNLLLPSGKVQRVQYMNLLSPDNRLTSNVQYDEVAPINGPVYTFGAPLARVV